MTGSLPPVPRVFNRARVARNRDRAVSHLDHAGFLHDLALERLTDRLDDVKRDFPETALLGARPAPALIAGLRQRTATLYGADLSRPVLDRARAALDAAIETDEECLPFATGALDLVVSPLSLHAVNDLPGTLLQIRRALKPDGLFLAALFGGETLFELRQALLQSELTLRNGAEQRLAPVIDRQQAGALLQRAGFALPVVDSDIIRVTYPSVRNLMRDLRHMGEGHALATQKSRTPLTKTLLSLTEDHYHAHFADSEQPDKITATFEIIYMTGWAPHASQQKPLRPGSAENSLAEALSAEKSGLFKA